MPLLKLIISLIFVFFAAAAAEQRYSDSIQISKTYAKQLILSPSSIRGFALLLEQNNTNAFPWEEAKSSCTVFPNGHLAITSSPNVADFIAGNILLPQGINYSWVGLKESVETSGKWYWHHKTPQGLPTSTLSTTHNTTSSKKCVTSGVASPRLQEFDCNVMKHFVCQYSIGDREFVSVNSLRGKKAKYSSPCLSFTVDKEIKCIQIAGQMPASSLAYNSATQSCEVYMDFPEEMELEDAPGYEMTTQVGEESQSISCKKDELTSYLIPNSTCDVEGDADFLLESNNITLKPYTIPVTSYCPEKKPLYRHFRQIPAPDLRQSYAYNLQTSYVTGNQVYTNQGIDSYCVQKLGECGAKKLLVMHYHAANFDQVIAVHPDTVQYYTKGAIVCSAW